MNRTPSDVAPAETLRVLHVEDTPDDSELVMRALRRSGLHPICTRVDTPAAFREALRNGTWDIILSDFSLPHYSGLAALADKRAAGRDIPFIIVSGTIGETVAVDAMKAGAQDYVLKGNLGRLPLAVEREVREARGRAEQRRMTERLAISERMASAGMLAAGVAHEINNPLAVVTANLDFLTERIAGLSSDATSVAASTLLERLRELDEPLRDAREAVLRIRGIVRDVKLFSRTQDERREPVDVRRVIESSIRMAWNEIRHRARLVKEYGNVSLVDSNEARLCQVFLNLLVNAAQAMPEGHADDHEIHIVTRMASGDERVVIEVRDTGVGIPREIMDRIFDPFFTTKPVGVGTGLGLALCYRMVTDLGGEIAVESEVGKGTIFRVTLPAASGEVSANVKPAAVVEPTRRAKVLIVDDEVAIGRVLERCLRPYHDVVFLTKGREALARIAAGEHFDAIFSDIMMPEMTGMELHEELMRIAPDQANRMIFVTGGAFTDRARTFLDSVPNLRIEKPFEMANILAIIGSWK